MPDNTDPAPPDNPDAALRYAYEILNLDPSAPIETQTPDELLACWNTLTPDDRAILIRWARLLAAADLPEALSQEVRGGDDLGKSPGPHARESGQTTDIRSS